MRAVKRRLVLDYQRTRMGFDGHKQNTVRMPRLEYRRTGFSVALAKHHVESNKLQAMPAELLRT